MKKKLLTTAVLAGIAGTAGAVNVNPDGLGQVGLLSYYTVQGGYDTYVSIVNTTAYVKAVKVRFLEGKNSREVLDFNLYLSPYDVWTGAITTASATGPGHLLTHDLSCTVPAIPAGGVDFRNFQYTGTAFDGEDTSLARTREGHIEIIEMGVVNNEDTSDSDAFNPAEWATHDAGVPNDCPALVAAWSTGGDWTGNSSLQMSSNTGGLATAATLINVNEGEANGYNGVMLDNWRDSEIHTAPGTIFPNLSNASPAESSVFVSGAPGVVWSTWAGGPPPSDGLNAVSAVLMHDSLINEYTVEAGLAAGTDWVVTFPTKALYVAYEDSIAPHEPFNTIFGGGGSRPGSNTGPNDDNIPSPTGPLRANWSTTGIPIDGGACEIVELKIWDREERTPLGDVDFSPQPEGGVNSLCWETNVITFNDTDVLNSQNLRLNVPTQGFENGWMRLSFSESSQTMTSFDGDVYHGLPTIGFAVENYVNGTLSGGAVLSNYGVLFNHRATRSIWSSIAL
jgi:hypothetical protein